MQTNWKHLCQLLFFLPAFCLGQTCNDWIAPTSSFNYLVNLQMALDPDGNSYQLVLIDSSATFYDAGGIGTELMNPTTEGGFSTVLVKYGPEGSVEWTLPFHSLKYTTPSSAGITYANGSLYVAGTYKEELLVDGESYPAANALNVEMFVARVSVEGELNWLKFFAQSPETIANHSVTSDSQGNILLGGYFTGQWTVSPDYVLGNPSGFYSFREAFVLKLDPDGELLWANASLHTLDGIENFGIARSWAIETDQNDDVLIGGFFQDTVNFGNTLLAPTNGVSIQPYVAKLDGSTGAFQWVFAHFQENLGGFASMYGLEVDDANNIYAIGAIDGPTTIDGTLYTPPGNSDLVVQKLDPAGNQQWLKIIGTDNGTSSDWGTKVIYQAPDQLYLYGNLNDHVDIDGNNYSNNGSRDVCLIQTDLDGTVQEVEFIGGEGAEASYDAAFDHNGDLFVITATNSPEFTLGDQAAVLDMNLRHVVIGKWCRSPSRVDPIPSQTEWTLYPNPCSNYLEVSRSISSVPAEQVLLLWDAYGRLVKQTQVPLSSSRLQLSLDDEAPGLYILEMRGRDGQVLQKQSFIKI